MIHALELKSVIGELRIETRMKVVFVRDKGAEYQLRPDSVGGLTAWLFLVQDERGMIIEKADFNKPKCRF